MINVMNESKELFPYFQPIVGVASGKIIGYEALDLQYVSWMVLYQF